MKDWSQTVAVDLSTSAASTHKVLSTSSWTQSYRVPESRLATCSRFCLMRLHHVLIYTIGSVSFKIQSKQRLRVGVGSEDVAVKCCVKTRRTSEWYSFNHRTSEASSISRLIMRGWKGTKVADSKPSQEPWLIELGGRSAFSVLFGVTTMTTFSSRMPNSFGK